MPEHGPYRVQLHDGTAVWLIASGFADARTQVRTAKDAANDGVPGYRWPGVLATSFAGTVPR